MPLERLTLSATFGYVDPKYNNYPKGLETGGVVAAGCSPVMSSTGVLQAQDCADIAKFVFFAKTTADFSIGYRLPQTNCGTWSTFAAYSYRGKTYSSIFDLPTTLYQDELAQKGYGLLSARIALSDIPMSGSATAEIAIFGDNLTDKVYNAQGTDFGTFAIATYGMRRTFGLEGRIAF